MWERLLAAKGLDPLRIREGRYDAVFHLVTAALGAESYYSLMNNSTRTESPEFAREVRYMCGVSVVSSRLYSPGCPTLPASHLN